jgi:hypothetical protein
MVMFILERMRAHSLLEGLSLMQNLHLKMAPYLVRGDLCFLGCDALLLGK